MLRDGPPDANSKEFEEKQDLKPKYSRIVV